MPSQLFQKKSLQVLLDEMAGEHRLRRILGPVTLTSLGVGAIIGTGIFVLVGKAAHDLTGPALMLSFVVAGLACLFAALCYAEFASMAPVAGSAYTYAYTTLGELMAWIIGWDLILEYAVASATVAVGWSKYFQQLISLPPFEWTLPEAISKAPAGISSAFTTFDLPAVAIVTIITVVLVIGIRESAGFNAAMVIVKVAVVFFVIGVGIFFVDPANWTPFAPYGYTGLSLFGKPWMGPVDAKGAPLGMLAGAATIFFAYIGFDSVSTHAEEARKPQRDVPIAIITSLVLCTILYIAVAAVLTGMLPYDQLDVDAPVAKAFEARGLQWASRIISIGALTGITSVLLVMMLSQPRVFLAMARDGLLPPGFFGAVHERFRTPWKSTILTGFFVAMMGAVLNIHILSELVNIGTLFAFVVVCASVLIMRRTNPDAHRPFRVPLYPLTPILGILLCLVLMFSLPGENWLRLAGWLLIGLCIYFFYGRHHSLLALETRRELQAHGATPVFPVRDPPGKDHPHPHE